MAQLLGDAHEAGQTPLDPDEAEDLRIPVATRGALNAVEAENIAGAMRWLHDRKLDVATVVNESFVRELHRRMFADVWTWAGSYRRSDENRGVPWYEVPIHIRRVIADGRAWIDGAVPADEAAVRFGHRIVVVHPFPNGNGRHSRLLSDCLARALDRPEFSWGTAHGPDARAAYLRARRAADGGDLGQLIAFSRS